MKKIILVMCLGTMLFAGLPACGTRGGDSSAVKNSSEALEESSGLETSMDDPAASEESEEMVLVQFQQPGQDALVATIQTSMGSVEAVLYPDYAPKAVENFYRLASDGYYDGMSFYNVLKGWYIVSGDPKGDGSGGESVWKKPFEDEFTDDLWNFRGALSMENGGKRNSNSSRFLIVQAGEVSEEMLQQMEDSDVFPDEVIRKYESEGGAPWLDHKNTVFGYVVSGMDVVDQIAEVPTDEEDVPEETITIESITFNRELASSSSQDPEDSEASK